MTDPKSLLSRRPRLLAALAVSCAFVAGGIATPPLAAAAQDAAMHGPMGRDPAKMHAMMAAHLDRMLSAVDATPDQKARIDSILGSAMRSMAGAHQQMHARMGQLHAILSAPTIDRSALESLRASAVADIDTQSRTLVSAMADAAEVLTPQQRAKLAAMMHDRAPG